MQLYIYLVSSRAIVYFIDILHCNIFSTDMDQLLVKMFPLCLKMRLGSEHGMSLDGKVNEPPLH